MALTQKTPLKRTKPLKRKRFTTGKSKLQRTKDRPGSRYWRNKADRAWSLLILRKNDGRCMVCGEPAVDPHHLISRSLAATRHSLTNGIPLCRSHHSMNPRMSAHLCPLAFAEWLRTKDPTLYGWVQEHRFDLCPKPNYRKRHEQLRGILDAAGMEAESDK